MSTMSDWTVQSREPGWFGRMIAPPEGGRPATLTFVLGALAAGAFIGSLALDWQSVTVPTNTDGSSERREQHFTAAIASIDTLSLVYTLGVVALLGAVGAVLTRPDLALRLRMAVVGVTVGLLGVLAAITLRLTDTVANLPTVYFGVSVEQLEQMTLSYEPGLFCGYAAAVLPLAAIWRAGQLAGRAAAGAMAAGGSASAGAARAASRSRRDATRAGEARLDVTFSEPLDLSVGPGDALPFR